MKGSTMMKEERNLVYTACKRQLEPEFKLMLTLKTLETFGKFESNALGDPFQDPGQYFLRKPRSTS